MYRIHRSLREKKPLPAIVVDNAFAEWSRPLPQNSIPSPGVIAQSSPSLSRQRAFPKNDISPIEISREPQHANLLLPDSPCDHKPIPPTPRDTTNHETMDTASQQSGDPSDSTRDSAISGLSILADEEDTFYQRSMSHFSRDRQRLQDAVNSNSVPAFAAQPHAFRKARPQHRIALTMDNLARVEGARDREGKASGPPSGIPRRRESLAGGEASSGTGRGASYNLPREWGRKGTQKNEFLKRMNSTGDLMEHSTEQDPDRIYPRRTLYTGDSPEDSRELNVDAAGSSVEVESPLSTKKRPLRSRRSTSGRINPAIDDIIALERQQDEDEVDDSPRGSSKARQQHMVVRGQIDDTKQRAVTTNRLADVAKRSLRMPNSLTNAFRKTGEPPHQAGDSFSKGTSHIPTRSGQVNGTLTKPRSTGFLRGGDGRDNPGAQDIPKQNKNDSSTSPKPTKRESRDLLRKLARASSTTPSPSQEPIQNTRDRNMLAPSPSSKGGEPGSLPYGSLGSRTGEVEPQQKRASSLFAKVPSRSSSLRSSNAINGHSPSRIPKARSPASSSPRSRLSATNSDENEKLPIIPSTDQATPKISGAFVETPGKVEAKAPAGSQEPAYREDEPPEPLRSHPVSKPRRSSSGSRSHRQAQLQSEDARRQPRMEELAPVKLPDDIPIDETTDVTDAELAKLKLELDDDTLALVANVATPLRDSPKPLRPDEADALSRMAKSLRDVKSGLQDASKDITRVEKDFNPTRTSLEKAKQQRAPTPTEHVPLTSPQPNLFTILANTLATIIAIFVVVNPRTGRRRPTRKGWWAIGILIYGCLEYLESLVSCSHVTCWYYPTYYPLPTKQRCRMPFMTLCYDILEPTEALWRPFWKAWCWLWRFCYGKELQWVLWEMMKFFGLSWIMAPAPGLSETMPYPSWWWDRYGGPYGGGRGGCRQFGGRC